MNRDGDNLVMNLKFRVHGFEAKFGEYGRVWSAWYWSIEPLTFKFGMLKEYERRDFFLSRNIDVLNQLYLQY